MSIKEENELLVSLNQQSELLRRTLDDLNGIWSDEASRTLESTHLSPHLDHDDQMLQALQTQTELLYKSDAWINAAHQHMKEADIAHRRLKEHLLYAQQQMAEAEHKRRDALALQQEVKDMLPKIQQLIQDAHSSERA
jgi:hypothetical protein